jgi:hypothetical protein
VRQGELEDVGAETLRVTLDGVRRRLAASPPVGEPIKPLGAWAILALASSDAAFRGHVAARLSQQEQSRARLRLKDRGLPHIVPRLHQRAVARRYTAGAESLLAVARSLGWPLPDGEWPAEIYVPEAALVDFIEGYALDLASEQTVDVPLPKPWESCRTCYLGKITILEGL